MARGTNGRRLYVGMMQETRGWAEADILEKPSVRVQRKRDSQLPFAPESAGERMSPRYQPRFRGENFS
jgi:hypothetical protein